MMSNSTGNIDDTPTCHRNPVLDSLRGLALLGILAVNMEFLSQTLLDGWAQPRFGSWLDIAARWLVLAFFQMKAYLLFALLFGYGIGLQIRTRRRTVLIARRKSHIRRMAILFIIGLVHASLLFAGDILVTYAMLGLISMLVWHKSTASLLVYAKVSFAIGMTIGVAVMLLPEELIADADIYAIRTVYSDGSIGQVVAQRLTDVSYAFPFILLVQGPMAFTMLLLGVVMARLDILTNPGRHRSLLRMARNRMLPIGLLGGMLTATATLMDGSSGLISGIAFLLQLATGPVWCLGLISQIAVFLMSRTPRRYVLLAASGRMSLTLYVGQSLIAAMIFTSYGLGWFADIGPAACLALTAVMSVFLMIFSSAWLRHYRFGPLEWLLRSGTYGKWQKLRQRQSSPRLSTKYTTWN